MSTSTVVIAIYWCFAAALVFAGVVKFARPATLATLLSTRVGRPRLAARLLGVAEVGAGCVALAGAPGAPFAVAAVYLALGIGAEVLLRTGANGSCGCFGSGGGRLTVGQVLFDGVATAAALTVGGLSVLGSRELSPLGATSAPATVLVALQLAFAAWLAARVLGELTETWALWNNPFAGRGGQ
jgi:hypothetical protein